MIIGIPKETMNEEYRVGATPSIVSQIISEGHQVIVETNAGKMSGFEDDLYLKAGAKLANSPKDLWDNSELIYKVKDPTPDEYKYFREDLIIFCYLHLANNAPLKDALIQSKAVAIGYETIEDETGLPLLKPMSEIGGIMAVVEGSNLLKVSKGGKGKTLMGMPGVPPGHVVVLGDGTAGRGAIRTAIGMGARVTVIGRNIKKLSQLQDIYGARLETLYSNQANIASALKDADLFIGAVLVAGEKAPKLVTEDMVKSMKEGSVILDISVDQGSIVETIDRTTSHSDPTFVKHGIVHYAVPNIPGSVPATATTALTNVTVKYLIEIANKGWHRAAVENQAIKKGINVSGGYIRYEGVAKAFGEDYLPID